MNEPDEVGYSPEPAPVEAQEASGATTPQRPYLLGGITGKGFLPGHSGNPTGNPPGLRSLIRKKTKDGREIIRLMHGIMKGKAVRKMTVIDQETGKMTVHKAHPSPADRLDAAKWLAERGWGKVKDAEGDDATRRPFVVRLQGESIEDPFDTPEAQDDPSQKKLPALPAPMPEIGFDMNLKDLEEKP